MRRLRRACPGGSVAVGGGFVWVTDASRDTVVLISDTTGDVARSIPVGKGPSAIAVSRNSVWVVLDRR